MHGYHISGMHAFLPKHNIMLLLRSKTYRLGMHTPVQGRSDVDNRNSQNSPCVVPEVKQSRHMLKNRQNELPCPSVPRVHLSPSLNTAMHNTRLYSAHSIAIP